MPKDLKSTKMIDYRPIEIDDQKYKKSTKGYKIVPFDVIC